MKLETFVAAQITGPLLAAVYARKDEGDCLCVDECVDAAVKTARTLVRQCNEDPESEVAFYEAPRVEMSDGIAGRIMADVVREKIGPDLDRQSHERRF